MTMIPGRDRGSNGYGSRIKGVKAGIWYSTLPSTPSYYTPPPSSLPPPGYIPTMLVSVMHAGSAGQRCLTEPWALTGRKSLGRGEMSLPGLKNCEEERRLCAEISPDILTERQIDRIEHG